MAVRTVEAAGVARTTITTTIPSGDTTTPAVDLGGGVLGAIEMPAAWTAADLVLLASSSADGTYHQVYDSLGTWKVSTASANRIVLVDTGAYILRYIKLKSVSTSDSSAGVAQTREGGTTLTLHVRPI